MKFVKENLLLVICAAVALVFVGLLFYPLGSMVSQFQADMKTRYDQTNTIKTQTNMELKIPGAESWKGIPTPNITEFKSHLIESINKGAQDVQKEAANLNAQGRVGTDGTPLLNGTPIKGYVPRLTGDPLDYKKAYGAQFTAWTTLLVGKAGTPGTPPDAADLQASFTAMLAARQANMPAGMQANVGAQDPKEALEYQRNKVLSRAAEIQMYVDPSPTTGSFQVRPWFLVDEPPNEQQIFESMVDSWLQGEVVRAIAAVNKPVLDKAASKDRNVGSAPIKRLIHVMVGNNAMNRKLSSASSGGGMQTTGGMDDPGYLFFSAAAAAGNGGGAPPPAPAADAAAAGALNYDASMTGHVSNAQYDVVLMSIHLDADPAYVQRFVDQLYRQNVGYTVLNEQIRTVDPLDRVSFGYVYGETQTVEVEILVEALLLRSWTVPLMPASVKTALNIPATPAKP